MNRKQLITKVKALNLPIEEYVVFGSGPLAVHGIRPTRDIDLFISASLWNELYKRGWEEKTWDTGGTYLSFNDEVEADKTWRYGYYNPSFIEIKNKAETIEGVPFVPLSEVKLWKQAFGRKKDNEDIRLIKSYLHSKANE